MSKTNKKQAADSLIRTVFYEQKLEPIIPTEYTENGHTYRSNYLSYAEEMLPPEARKRYFAVYEILKPLKHPFDSDDEPMEVGTYFRDQILLPHQERGGIIVAGRQGKWILEALSKNYLRFKGVEAEDDDES